MEIVTGDYVLCIDQHDGGHFTHGKVYIVGGRYEEINRKENSKYRSHIGVVKDDIGNNSGWYSGAFISLGSSLTDLEKAIYNITLTDMP